MRADRLIRVLLVLQSRSTVTAAELADDLEVSIATARRDLAALSSAGVPVYPQRGRGGGWSLVGGARTNLTGLTEPEATALFALIGQIHGVPGEAATAIRKLVQALPSTFRSGAERAIGSTVRDDAPWGAVHQGPPETVAELQAAIAAESAVVISYADRGPVGLTPLGVAARGGTWYLLASRDAGEPRLYRADRIRDVRRSGRAAVRPAGFDLTKAWAAAVARVEELRGVVSARALVHAHAVAALGRAFGAQMTPMGAAADGRVRVELRAQSAEALAEQVAGWSAAAEVVEPAEVRSAIAALGARLVSTYG
ncbi:helix-turn-helix transcriptional regulator [Zhihengliuella salsuginis]|uniref:Transcriptional regulator n=1 Tax=Zhihengliuella salsuginis TaxID=578222 RepID=A0ABQ3GIY7_9MICC|nr:WYL domain-containing protein [Zhihengliuella salsuginis]GHD09702.1 transcriptional regulator [Zhihengliuella salsuginis]